MYYKVSQSSICEVFMEILATTVNWRHKFPIKVLMEIGTNEYHSLLSACQLVAQLSTQECCTG